jgi:hypothetical protein
MAVGPRLLELPTTQSFCSNKGHVTRVSPYRLQGSDMNKNHAAHENASDEYMLQGTSGGVT